MKADDLFKHNVTSLLRARSHTNHDLAQWCRRSDAWISKILGAENRNLPLKYLDRIADFFGLDAFQLFVPGITPLSERRSGQPRRSGRDRRFGMAQPTTDESMKMSGEDAALLRDINALTVDDRRRFESWIRATLAARDRGAIGSRPVGPPAATSTPTASTPPVLRRKSPR